MLSRAKNKKRYYIYAGFLIIVPSKFISNAFDRRRHKSQTNGNRADWLVTDNNALVDSRV